MKRILNILIFVSMIPILHAADPSISQTTDTADSIAQKIKVKWNSLTPTQKRNIKIAAGIAAGATAAVGIGAASSRIHRAYVINRAPQDQAEFRRSWNEQMDELKDPKERARIIENLDYETTKYLNPHSHSIPDWNYLKYPEHPDPAADELTKNTKDTMEKTLVTPTGFGLNYWQDVWHRNQQNREIQKRFKAERSGFKPTPH